MVGKRELSVRYKKSSRFYIKVTSQSYSKTLIVSRTELRKKAAVCGSSMNIYMRVASAIRRIVYNIINVN